MSVEVARVTTRSSGRAGHTWFEQADIYARASGYVSKRNVDIGDHVKAGNSSRRSPARKSITRFAQLQEQWRKRGDNAQNESHRSLAQVTWDATSDSSIR